jgi:hypothetical protein
MSPFGVRSFDSALLARIEAARGPKPESRAGFIDSGQSPLRRRRPRESD